ncbi:MAG: hypothetical protein EPO06_12045 [Burkholderiaceae bacterium]|nr:MAG: hypothetical protein EPO06_12045 [Burkholderiaceae bacterium]
MTANRDLILAGVAGGGEAGNALAWFAPKGTTLPTAIDDDLDAAFLDSGWVTEDGLKKAVSESTNDVKGFGTQVPLRVLTTESKVTFEIAFLESGVVPLSIYNRLSIDTGDILTPDGNGRVDFTEGRRRTIEYAAVFEIVDGLNLIRAVVPALQVTDRKEQSIKAGDPITYGVTLTAYPDDEGVAIHWFYQLDALAS